MSGPSAHRAPLDALAAHASAYLGHETGRAQLEGPHGPLVILRFEPMAGMLVLVTAGAALDAGRREALLVLPAEPEQPVLGAACAALAAFAEAQALGPVGAGFTPAPDVFDGFDFDAVLLMPPQPFADGLARLELPDGPVLLDWLVPGYEEELAYLREHGPRALGNLLSAQRLDPQDFSRGPASTLVSPEDAAQMSGADSDDRGYRVEQVRGGVRIERRRRKIGQGEAAPRPPAPAARPMPEPDPEPSPSPSRRPPPARRSPVRSARSGRRERKRFDINGGEASSAPATTPVAEAAPAAPAPPLDPAEAKRQRVEALKAKAIEARERAEARKRGEVEPTTTAEGAPVSRPEQSRAVLAAERRRGRAGPRGPKGPKPPRRGS